MLLPKKKETAIVTTRDNELLKTAELFLLLREMRFYS